MASRIIEKMDPERVYTATDMANELGVERAKVGYALSDMVARGQVQKVAGKPGGPSFYQKSQG
ncbi:hypothetical protein [Roseinatronobacter sp. NSM]|uniref:hypothetical protein n=1 Tax=Roseinatronobacter sp. NSM TaxID=3457785 RepID=UPI004037465C